MEKALDENCSQCHTTCGQCHVSQPDIAGAGLIDGHLFKKKPNQLKNCVVCHESRTGAEFTGGNGRLEASVHYRGGMTCMDCHTGMEIHGFDGTADNRYEVESLPACRDCHGDGIDTKNAMHEKHIDDLECHVCHSLPYSNCYYCHAESPDSQNPLEPGIQFEPEIDFRIGRSPMKDERHTSDYALLRHVPIHRETFADYGIELDDYASEPTWKYASPHNIQLQTPQNASCNKCHGNPNIFLTEYYVNIKISQGAVTEEELAANQDVILDEVP